MKKNKINENDYDDNKCFSGYIYVRRLRMRVRRPRGGGGGGGGSVSAGDVFRNIEDVIICNY